MRRDVARLGSEEFDVVIVGGGIHGAATARDASLRGLKVALIEQGDFCSATSHNSLKTIHGGIRYLQHFNFARTIESIREKQIWLQTAPHLVKPLRFLLPAKGMGMRGPFGLLAGLIIYEALNLFVSLIDKRRPRWPEGRLTTAAGFRGIAKGAEEDNLSGGAIWADAQVELADKAVLQILQNAENNGAVVANYMRAMKLKTADGAVSGIYARDLSAENDVIIKGRQVVNATGPWVSSWLGGDVLAPLERQFGLVKSMNLLTVKDAPSMAFGVSSNRASDSKIDTAERSYFLVPWRGKAIIGTTHFPHKGNSSEVQTTPEEVSEFIAEFNESYPAMGLTSEDILYCYHGLTPGENEDQTEVQKSHEAKIFDHAGAGAHGLFSVLSIKWTTARLVAEQVVDKLFEARGETVNCKTRTEPIPNYVDMPDRLAGLSLEEIQKFVEIHVARTQAAQFDDIVFRRTNDLLTAEIGPQEFYGVLDTLADIFEWSSEVKLRQLKQVLERLHPSSYRDTLLPENNGGLL